VPYRYEDLDDKRFQSLVQALLSIEYPGLICMPVGAGQTDGGRDAVLRPTNSNASRVIFQVKWSADDRPLREPAKWVRDIVKGEDANIRRLVSEGARRYVIVTSVRGTASRGRGTIGEVEGELDKLSKQYKVPMLCNWRHDVDIWMDKAPDGVKWKYADALVGHDALRALLQNLSLTERVERQARIVRELASTEWVDDENLRFKQAGLDRAELNSLFVDVLASWHEEDSRRSSISSSFEGMEPAGGAAILLESPAQRSVFLGAPGQGKSTLLQYVCQVHRAGLLKKEQFLSRVGAAMDEKKIRVVFRVDLRDYAQWVEGRDPFSEDDKPARRPRDTSPVVESYLAFSATRKIGSAVTPDDIKDIVDRYPCFFAFDGLDEVANERTRERVVIEIEKAAGRFETCKSNPVAVVTARPSYSQLPLPDPGKFAYYRLLPLNEHLRVEYMRRWLHLQNLGPTDRRSVQRVFRERSAEPHVRELSTNPMQLAILLYLVHQRADSVPGNRTKLYQDYMSRFLDRESSKDASVNEHRATLEEVTGYLGWYMQSLSEDGDNGRLKTSELKRVIRHYLADLDKDSTLVETLFTAATTRVWVLTSRVQGYFEFDVQPVREFFAAKHLVDTSPPSGRAGKPDKFIRFMELAKRPYWLNTARFMAGFFLPGELSSVVDEFDDSLGSGGRRLWLRRVLLDLLSDGVFDGRPKVTRRAVRTAYDATGILVNEHDISYSGVSPLAADRGGEELASLLMERAAAGNGHLGITSARLLARHIYDGPRVSSWWLRNLAEAADGERGYWLKVGALLGTTRELPEDVVQGLAVDQRAAALLVAGGASHESGSKAEALLLDSVCDGNNIDLGFAAGSFPADVATVFHPSFFIYRLMQDDPNAPASAAEVGSPVLPLIDRVSNRRGATSRVRRRSPQWAKAVDAIRQGKGQSGTTSVWGNTARAIEAAHRPCWLAREIALVGAACRDLKVGGDIYPNASPFGLGSDPAVLIREVKFNLNRPDWWVNFLQYLDSDLDRAVWVLGMVACASARAIGAALDQLVYVASNLPQHWWTRVESAAWRLSSSGVSRTLPSSLAVRAASVDVRVCALLAQHVDLEHRAAVISALSEDDLIGLMADPFLAEPLILAANQPSVKHAKVRRITSLEFLRALGPSCPLPHYRFSLTDSDAGEVLKSPSDVPLFVLLGADRFLSSMSMVPTLRSLSEGEGWFEDAD
jgi:hypothetical protein